MNRQAVAVIAVAGCCWLAGSSARGQEQKAPPNGFQQDFRQLVEALETRHPGMPRDPLPMLPPGAFEREWTAVYERLGRATTVNGFYYEAMGFLSRLHDAHANVSFSLREQRVLPLTAQWLGDRLVVVDVQDEAFGALRNAELLAIAGVPVLELEKRVATFMPSDRGAPLRVRKPQFGSAFFMTVESALAHLGLLKGDAVEVTYVQEGGRKVGRLPFGPAGPAQAKPPAPRARNAVTAYTRTNSFTACPDISTIYLQLSNPSADLEDGFFERLFEEVREKRIRNLVVDLRDASGGDAERCLELLRYVLTAPRECYLYRSWQRSGAANELQFDGRFSLTPVAAPLRFAGKVFLFVGPNTFSAGTFPAVLALDNDLATVLGEPCGNASARYGAVERVKLAHTNLTFQFSTRIWERAKPGAGGADRPIEPHIRVVPTPEDDLAGRDPVWDRFLALRDPGR